MAELQSPRPSGGFAMKHAGCFTHDNFVSNRARRKPPDPLQADFLRAFRAACSQTGMAARPRETKVCRPRFVPLSFDFQDSIDKLCLERELTSVSKAQDHAVSA